MKTPHFLLAALLAAPAVHAQVVAPARCDAKWLTDSGKILSAAGGVVSDERIKVVANAQRLVFGHAKTCDAGTWRNLATDEAIQSEATLVAANDAVAGTKDLKWRSAPVGAAWKAASAADQIKMVLAVNLALNPIDAQALKVNAAADAVIEAARGLGLASVKAGEKTLAELLNGASGGPVGVIKPATVAILEPSVPATIGPDDIEPAMRKLVNDGGGSQSPGAGVLLFRVEVLKLGELLQAQAAADAQAKKTTLIVPAGFQALKAVDSNAMVDAKYNGGLAALVGAGEPAALNATALRAGSALEPIDLGLRNLVSARSAEIDKIFAAAKKRLSTTTIAQMVAARRQAERDSKEKVTRNSLAANALGALTGSKDYSDLEALYTARLKRDGATPSAETAQLGAQLEAMRTAAGTTTVEKDATTGREVVKVQLNGKTVVLDHMPQGLLTDNTDQGNAKRDWIASEVAGLILRDSKADAKMTAFWAAIKGDGQPGGSLDDTRRPNVAGSIPPVNGSTTVETAWDKARKSPQAGCGSPSDLGKSEMERIAARKAEAAADAASDNSSLRGKLQKELNRSDEQIKKRCASQEAEINKMYLSPDIKDPAAERQSRIATLRAACTDDINKARAAIWAKPEYASVVDQSTQDQRKADELARADQEIADLYDSGIEKALAELEIAYAKKGDKHRKDLERATGYHDAAFNEARVKAYFDDAWRGSARDAAYASCREKFGYKKGMDLKKTPLQNPRADREEGVEGSVGVDVDCGVRAGIVAAFNAYKGSVSTTNTAPVTVGDLPGSVDVNAELGKRKKP